MNVLGKIKSKKQNVSSNTQNLQQIEEKPAEEKTEEPLISNPNNEHKPESYQSQIPSKKIFPQKRVEEKKTFRPIKPVEEIDYIINTNVLTKHKETAIKEKEPPSTLMMTSNTPSNNFFTTFQTNKPSKNSNSGVYFDSNTSVRSSNFLSDSNHTTNQRPKTKKRESFETEEEEMYVDFDFLLSNKEKKEVKRSIHLEKNKLENEKEVENDLKANHEEVLCFYIKKWTIYGDIFMLEGEIESLKKGYIELDLYETKRKVNNKMKIKLSCGRDIISSLETIGRLYVSGISFLSEMEAMMFHENLIGVMQKGKKAKR